MPSAPVLRAEAVVAPRNRLAGVNERTPDDFVVAAGPTWAGGDGAND